MSIRSLDPMLRPVYVVPRDDVAGSLLIPAMSESESVRCMAGFFSSSSFTQLAPGLAAFINRTKGTFRLLLSPRIEDKDRQAIESATADPETVMADAAERLFKDGQISDSALARHTVQCLAYLIASGRAELRIVLTRRGMFHPKVWILSDNKTTLVAHGSSNPTQPGLLYNYETVSIERSWVETAKTQFFSDLFDRVWEGKDSTTLTIGMPEGLALVKAQAGSTDCPTVEDFWTAWHVDGWQRPCSPSSRKHSDSDSRAQNTTQDSGWASMGKRPLFSPRRCRACLGSQSPGDSFDCHGRRKDDCISCSGNSTPR